MSTGLVTTWAEKISEIGAIYPFVGWEKFMVLVAVIFWLGWHVWQIKISKKENEDIMGD